MDPFTNTDYYLALIGRSVIESINHGTDIRHDMRNWHTNDGEKFFRGKYSAPPKTKLYDTFYLNKQWRKLAMVCVRRGLKQARVSPADLCLRRKTIGTDKLYAIDRGFAV